jgi:hypothetical protein
MLSLWPTAFLAPRLCRINFDTCQLTSINVAPIKIAHGVLMSVAWGILLPVGIVIAKFYRHVEPKVRLGVNCIVPTSLLPSSLPPHN